MLLKYILYNFTIGYECFSCIFSICLQAASYQFSTSSALKAAKFYDSAEDAVRDIPNGAKLLVGGIQIVMRESCSLPVSLTRQI